MAIIKKSLTLVVLILSVKEGDMTYCERIKDTDRRMLCKAEVSGSKTWCGFIKDSDLRAKCYAIVHH